MILIADAGSTKINWALLHKSGKVVATFVSGSMNPVVSAQDIIRVRVRNEVLPQLRLHVYNPDAVWFYGAGCIPAVVPEMEALLASELGGAECHVYSDMLGAARGLCGRETGIVCVLGTGSNSCLYNGSEIIENVSPLGYILGDEGSGAVLGRRLAGDVYKRQLSDDLCRAFTQWLGMERDEVIRRVYMDSEANKFLASFTRFIAANILRPEMSALVTDEFCRFLTRNVAVYSCAHTVPVHFTGSVADVFELQLRDALGRCSMICGNVVGNPLPAIVRYHQDSII